jgi:hypothetical protein
MAGEENKKESPSADQRVQPARRSRQKVGAGLAFDIGSAAIVAALLYAGRSRRRDRN